MNQSICDQYNAYKGMGMKKYALGGWVSCFYDLNEYLPWINNSWNMAMVLRQGVGARDPMPIVAICQIPNGSWVQLLYSPVLDYKIYCSGIRVMIWVKTVDHPKDRILINDPWRLAYGAYRVVQVPQGDPTMKIGLSALVILGLLSSCAKTPLPDGEEYAFGVQIFNRNDSDYRTCSNLKVDVEQHGDSQSLMVVSGKGATVPFVIRAGYTLNITASCLDSGSNELGKTTWSKKVPNILPDGAPSLNAAEVRNALKVEPNSNPVVTPPRGM